MTNTKVSARVTNVFVGNTNILEGFLQLLFWYSTLARNEITSCLPCRVSVCSHCKNLE